MSKQQLPKYVAIDFDGVLAEWDGIWNETPGQPIKGARQSLYKLKQAGCVIIIYSSRGEESVRKWLKENRFPFDYINENPESVKDFDGDTKHISKKKPYFDLLIEDRGICFNGNWKETLHRIRCFRPWWQKERVV